VPNRDFLHLYGPGSLWVLAGVFAVFGVSIHVERVIGALQLLGVVLAVRSWLDPWGAPLATVGGVVAVVFAMTPVGLVALAWMGGFALLLWGLLLLVRSLEGAGRHMAVAGGVVCGFALLYRPDLIAPLTLAAIVLVPPLRRARLLGATAAAVTAGAAPMLVHVALAGPVAAFEGMFVDPVFRLRAGRRLPVPPSSDRLDSFLQRVNELDVIGWPHPFSVPVQLRVWFFAVIVATVVVVVAALRTRRGSDGSDGQRARRLAVLAAVSVGVLTQAMQRPDSAHLAWVSVVTIPVLPVAIAELMPASFASRVRIATAAVPVIALMALGFPAFTLRPYTELALQSAGEHRNAITVEHRGRTFYVGAEELAASAEAIALAVERETSPGDRLFVGPSDLTRTPFVDTWLYHLFPDLEPATYFLEMDPGLANADGSRLARDLASADAVILTDTWAKWSEPNDSVRAGDTAAAAVLDEQFCVAAAEGALTLYVPCVEAGG